MADGPLVKVDDLHRHFGALHAVQGVSFEVGRGEVLGLLGPNGAGKTTTLRMLGGVLPPSQGRISIDGFDLVKHPRQYRQRLGYLPEHPPLYPELTVDEYLRYCARLRGVGRREAPRAVTLAKERCGLVNCGPRLIGILSKGFQQRIGIAQAIVHHPVLVILDEPTAGLDPIQVREIRGLIRELSLDHGIVLSTHILPEVQAVCDRVQIIDRGRHILTRAVAELSGRKNQLRVTFLRPPNDSTLESVDGIERVENRGDGCLRVHLEDDVEVCPTLVKLSVEHDWGLTELVRERESLEELFVRLTSGEESPR